MSKLKTKSRVSKVINDLRSNDNITVISREKSIKINREISNVIEKARIDFEFKEKNSRAFVAQMELSTFNK
jgi:hypothetical protein